MKLEDIGFYTLTDHRAKSANIDSPLQRCELILTNKCNFKCPYCRGTKLRESILPIEKCKYIIDLWASEWLRNIRFSGGEPTLHPDLVKIVQYTTTKKTIKRIAISTNGSADYSLYKELFYSGINDFSISLDACCSSTGEKMSGGDKSYKKIIENISKLSSLTYVSIGTVVTEANIKEVEKIIILADSLGVADIRIIPAAQNGNAFSESINIDDKILNRHPILKYRVNNLKDGKPFRGINPNDSHKCYLMLDDMVVKDDEHYPCVIKMREGCKPIGRISAMARKERFIYLEHHDSFMDDICRQNCLDVCVDYNNKARELKEQP